MIYRLAQFARTRSTAWQATASLARLDRIINNHDDKFANRCCVVPTGQRAREILMLAP
jgi:hypothetical protein